MDGTDWPRADWLVAAELSGTNPPQWVDRKTSASLLQLFISPILLEIHACRISMMLITGFCLMQIHSNNFWASHWNSTGSLLAAKSSTSQSSTVPSGNLTRI